MELTILLSKVFGIYLITMGLVMIIRRDHFMFIVNTFPEERLLRFMVGIIMFVAGVFLILQHNDWSSLPAGLVSLLGWMMALKALVYMNLSDRAIKKWIGLVNVPSRYIWGGLISILLGIYLINFSFGLGWF